MRLGLAGGRRSGSAGQRGRVVDEGRLVGCILSALLSGRLANDAIADLEQGQLRFPALGRFVQVADSVSVAVAEVILGRPEDNLGNLVVDVEREAELFELLTRLIHLVDEIGLFAIDVLGMSKAERGSKLAD